VAEIKRIAVQIVHKPLPQNNNKNLSQQRVGGVAPSLGPEFKH
jgi:hypothetical protein